MNRQQYRLFNLLCRVLKSAAAVAALTASLLAACAVGQNPVPQIVGPVHPDAVAPGGGDFTLSVYGANFVPGAVVNWNYQPRATTYISGHEIQAQILSTDIAKNTAGYISVTNPAPGGGSSSASWAQVEVHAPISTVVVNTPVYYDFGFWVLQAADFTHDGVLDIVGEYGRALGFGRGTANGTFGPWSLASPNYLTYPTTRFAYGDFNGDGNLDVTSVSAADSQSFATHMIVRLGDGKGHFSAGPSLESHWGDFYDVVVGDFNQDGRLDLVTKGGSFLSTYLGNGDGTFRHAAHYLYPAYGFAAQMLAGDFNGDGKLDLILLQAPYLSFNNNGKLGIAFWFLQGNGDGTFARPQEIASFPGATICAGGQFSNASLQFSDFNGDGKLDLAFCNQSQIGVMLGNGHGTFQPPVFYTADSTGQGFFTFAIGDINSDGKPDLLVSEYSNVNNPQFVTFLGNGDGTFQAPQTTNVTLTQLPELGITVGDFNSDGLLDFIYQIGTGMDVFVQQ